MHSSEGMKNAECLIAALLAALPIVALAGCAMELEDRVIDARAQTIIVNNALSSNALSSNALSSNALSSNALSSNAYELNTLATNGMQNTAEGLELLRYIARCALPAGEVLVVPTDSGVVHQFPGLLGIASGWKYQPLSMGGQHAMSACLLSHVNAYGVSVSISVRRHGVSDVSEEEAGRFRQYEATYFGNVFDLAQPMYACLGDAAPEFSVPYPLHDITRGDRLLRRCADVQAGSTSETECGFIYVGACSAMCDQQNGGSHQQCWSERTALGTRYDETMSVWLLAHDDADSVWADHYDAIYGL